VRGLTSKGGGRQARGNKGRGKKKGTDIPEGPRSGERN